MGKVPKQVGLVPCRRVTTTLALKTRLKWEKIANVHFLFPGEKTKKSKSLKNTQTYRQTRISNSTTTSSSSSNNNNKAKEQQQQQINTTTTTNSNSQRHLAAHWPWSWSSIARWTPRCRHWAEGSPAGWRDWAGGPQHLPGRSDCTPGRSFLQGDQETAGSALSSCFTSNSRRAQKLIKLSVVLVERRNRLCYVTTRLLTRG